MFVLSDNVKFLIFSLIEVALSLDTRATMKQLYADKGGDIVIPCPGVPQVKISSIIWVHHGNHSEHKVMNDGSLLLSGVDPSDAGIYECSIDNDTDYIEKYNLTVRTVPPPLVNVTVHASTILALILWDVAGDGGHPIVDFTAQYREAKLQKDGELEDWRPISPNHISPNSRQIDVYHLDPNSSYWFRVWATNVLGSSEPVEVVATTLITDETEELVKHLLSGAEQFDPRAWSIAVGIVMSTLVLLSIAVALLLAAECRRDNDVDPDAMELVPNIILNPGFIDPDKARTYATQIVKSPGCPGPGKPRKV